MPRFAGHDSQKDSLRQGHKRQSWRRCRGFFLGLVVIARAKHPIPSRTRPLSAVAPMVLRLKTWESRSPPNLKRNPRISQYDPQSDPRTQTAAPGAGWSSPVARQAHNLKVAGSNPAPATNDTCLTPAANLRALACAPSPSQSDRKPEKKQQRGSASSQARQMGRGGT